MFLSHIVISFNGNSEFGTAHYRELLFSVGRMDIILGNYGHLKEIYFIELLNNFFLPVSLKDVSLALGYDPHCLIYSLMILGGFPLALSVLIFIVIGVFKNFKIIEKRYPIYEIDSREPKRIGGERKMRPLQVGALLSYQIIKEFIFWK